MPRPSLYLYVFLGLVLFYASIASAGVAYRNIHVFGRSAAQPSSGLVLDAQGYAYGTTFQGGSKGGGTVYRLSPTGAFEIIYVFSGHPDGKHPQGNVAFDANGNLYGTTVNGGKFTSCNSGLGCGTVFMLAPPPSGKGIWKETVLYDFAGPNNDGANPQAGVILDAGGDLYGTTEYGGRNVCIGSDAGCGTVFELERTQSGWVEIVLHNFGGVQVDGATPVGGLIFDSAGNLYGAAAGTAYEMAQSEAGWQLTVLHYFGGGSDGDGPRGSLAIDAQGNLYGTTYAGGQFSNGTVYELTPDAGGWIETILHNFAGGSEDGAQPQAGVTLDANGTVYGTTYDGGGTGNGPGTVFELTINSGQWTEALYRFKPNQWGKPASSILLINTTAYMASNASPGAIFSLSR